MPNHNEFPGSWDDAQIARHIDATVIKDGNGPGTLIWEPSEHSTVGPGHNVDETFVATSSVDVFTFDAHTPGNDTDTVIGASADDFFVFTYFQSGVNSASITLTDIDHNGITDTQFLLTDGIETSTINVLDFEVNPNHVLTIPNDPFMF